MVIQLAFLWASFDMAGGPGARPESPAAALARQLGDAKIWTDPRRLKELREALQEVPRLRPAGLLPVLARHIHYRPPMFSLSEGDRVYYAFHALKSYGLKAVEPLLNELKADPIPKGTEGIYREIFLEDGERKSRTAVHCLEEIYAEGGFGREMARARIELQLRTEEGEARKRLERAIQLLNVKR